MNSADLKQRLLAILAADAVGYSRLMAIDDRGTVAALDAARAVFRSRIEAGHGRVIDMAGDSVLAVFETAAGAVTAAIAVQQQLGASTGSVPQDRRMLFRIGIHMGDVIEKADGTVYGDGVNIASRLCAVAEAGGIVVSDAVHGAVRDRIVASFVDQGEQPMKNIAHLVHAFQLKPAEPAPSPPPSRSTSPALRLPDRPSLAVLPFTNMSGDPEQEYFADGITEDIITDCSKISGLFVIARNSTFTFKKQNVDIKDVGAKLGVRHVLEGSVRRHGMRVRINVQLIDAESGGHVWADRYDRDLEDIFLVQDEVTRKIVETLEVRLTGNEEARRHDRGKVNGEAYDYLIRAKSCIVQFTEPALVETREMLERALTIDPELAQAYAYLAIARGVEYANAWNGRTADDLEENLAIARKACESDPAEPMSHHAMSNALMWLRRLDEAESAARRSVALDPNSAQSHGTLGIILDFSGRHAEAIESLAKALRLDPEFSLWRHAQGRAQFALGHDAEAEVSFKRRLIQMPGSDVTRAYLASLYGHIGRRDEAGRIWRELMALHPGYTIELTLRVLPYTSPAPLERFVAGLRKAGLVA
ncbi:adenylate/guanylate cyclase domain-containing protein [Variovorax sp. WS11]|uniref:adenylate/guanylate cyclase domain-containing protein n=1 Tax=Variovorax sp. WS11 TaxID=1105204 RepID=UPI0019502BCF|nr:adenylate/guanylate cyclase domain-containing protein [Variovorax sp. WS11]